MSGFGGFDHCDVRVSSLALVEAFYERLLPQLGLPRKTYSRVGADGEWTDVRPGDPYNVVEFFEALGAAEPAHFIGFIEDAEMKPTATRIAFRVESKDAVRAWEARLRACGAVAIEFSADFDADPALFFEDPAGTKLELCARHSGRE